MKCQCLLFDLGGVLYNIDHALTRKAMHSLQDNHADPIVFSLEHADPIFGLFDAGTIHSAEFRNHLRNQHHIQASDELIDIAWNAMLLGLYDDAIATVKALKKNYTVALLSNINEIHYEAIKGECEELFSLFDHMILSFQYGLRKPHAEIFQKTVSILEYSPNEILFFDDTPANCAAAESLGIRSTLINPSIVDWRNNLCATLL